MTEVTTQKPRQRRAQTPGHDANLADTLNPAATKVLDDDVEIVAPAKASDDKTSVTKAAWSLEIGQPPYLVGEKRVMRLTLASLNFAAYTRMMMKAGLTGFSEAGDESARMRAFAKTMMRERLRTRLRAWDGEGSPIPLSDVDILQMPRVYAGRVVAAVRSEDDAHPPGTVLMEGDGSTTPIHYKFGTPLRGGSANGTSGFPIGEVEFLARTLGDIEEVLAGETPFEQTLALIANCAKPVGTPAPLQLLPSWAVDQVTISDGLKIAEDVLPRFLA